MTTSNWRGKGIVLVHYSTPFGCGDLAARGPRPTYIQQVCWNARRGTHVMLYLMIRTVAVQGYGSLRDLLLPLGQLSVITGANGSGKSSVYRSLRLLADAALNSVVASLAREGWLAADFLGGSRDYRALCSPGNLVRTSHSSV